MMEKGKACLATSLHKKLYQWASGSRFAISARYDGLGSDGYKDFGLTIDYSLRF